MTASRYVTTFHAWWHPEWPQRTAFASVADGRRRALVRIARFPGDAILNGAVGFGSAYVDLLGAAILGARGHTVLLADATWQPGSRKVERLLAGRRPLVPVDVEPRVGRTLSRTAIRAMDAPTTHYAVLSTAELTTFPRLWGVPAERVHYVPFCATAEDQQAAGASGVGVFAGGDSLRDYRALLAAGDTIHAPVTIATRLPIRSRPNVRAGALPREEYDAQAEDAAVVVVPLIADTVRSGGQQTYLNAMLRGKPVVVTDAPGVRDYITDGVTGLIVAPDDPRALAAAINHLLDDPARARELGAAARKDVLERFTLERYFARLLSLADACAAASNA